MKITAKVWRFDPCLQGVELSGGYGEMNHGDTEDTEKKNEILYALVAKPTKQETRVFIHNPFPP